MKTAANKQVKNLDPLAWYKDQVMDRATDVLMILDLELHVRYANAAARDLFSPSVLVEGGLLAPLLLGMKGKEAFLEILRLALGTGSVEMPFAFIFADREFSGDLTANRVGEHRGEAMLVLAFRDNSSYIRLQHRLTHDEFFDRNSGLMNQRSLDIMLEKEIQLADGPAAWTGQSVTGVQGKRALIMVQIINLEHLKSIYAGEIINQIFEYLGSTITHAISPRDFVFKYDECRIVILISEWESKTAVLALAEKLADILAVPFHPGNVDCHLQTSMGITVYPEDGKTKDALLGNAAAALNYAQETGQPWLVYSRDIHRQAVERLMVRSGLSKAVKHNELELRYMTLVDREGKVKGLEALIRWRHPKRGILGPDKFLPVAIDARIIGALSRWVLYRWVLYRIVEDWENHFKDLGVFVTLNISALDLADLYLPGCVETAIHGRMPPEALKVEITESEYMENYDRASLAIQAFRNRGIEILIDDFGVGQSSLSCLKDIQAQCAKIDHSFARHVENSPEEKDFIAHMIALCHLRGLRIIIEGIENQSQFDLLADSGVDLFQGHHFGKPMPVEDLMTRWFPRIPLAPPDP